MSKSAAARSRSLVKLLTVVGPPAGMTRFLANGVLNTCFGYASFFLALRADAPVMGALLASTVAGTLFNFETTRRFVFQSREKGRLLVFLSVYAIIFIVDDVAILVLGSLGVGSAVAQALLALPLALLSFAAQRCWVFRKRIVR